MIVDLTHRLRHGFPAYPGDAAFALQPARTLPADGYNACELSGGLHVGTHIDVPSHLLADERTIADFPLTAFIGRGVLLRAKNAPSDALCRAAADVVMANDMILIETGWDERLGQPDYFTGHPCLHDGLADILLSARIAFIGLDTPSPDAPPFTLHKRLLAAGVPLGENLTDLGALSSALPDTGLAVTGFEVFAIPLRMEAEASYARIFARLP